MAKYLDKKSTARATTKNIYYIKQGCYAVEISLLLKPAIDKMLDFCGA